MTSITRQDPVQNSDPILYLTTTITDLIETDSKIHTQIDNWIIRNKTQEIPLFDSESRATIFLSHDFHTECGYKEKYKFINDILSKGSQSYFYTYTVINKGPYQGWQIRSGFYTRQSGIGISCRGPVGGSSRCVYSMTLIQPSSSCVLS